MSNAIFEKSDDLTEPQCFYCGEPADTKDHVVPVSYYLSRKRKHQNLELTSNYGKENLVDCCRECNSIAGNKVFDDVEDKKEFIQNRLRRKYKKVIDLPFWSDEEIDDLGYSLRKDVIIKQMARNWILNRVYYPMEIYSRKKLNKECANFLKNIL